jgi:hypothetical protein
MNISFCYVSYIFTCICRMLKHFRLFPFIIGIILGVIGVYYIKPLQTIVYKYPTPDNAGKITYKDKNGVCYKYSSKEVNCDSNQSRLKDFPLNK